MAKSRKKSGRGAGKSKQQAKPDARHWATRKTLAAIAVLILSAGAIAGARAFYSSENRAASIRGQISPASGPALSKEYIYAGSKLIATEEPASGCSYSLNPQGNSSVPSGGGPYQVTVTAGTSCGWTATSNAAWITITAGSSGTGNGTVSYTVAANNSSSSQIGTMTIAGQTFTVTEAGAASCAVTTSSGTGVYGYLEGNSTTAEWANPNGMTMAIDPVSGSHALFIADTDNERIRMLYLDGSS